MECQYGNYSLLKMDKPIIIVFYLDVSHSGNEDCEQFGIIQFLTKIDLDNSVDESLCQVVNLRFMIKSI